MRTLLLTSLLLAGLSLPALGLYLQPEIKEIPIDRLIANPTLRAPLEGKRVSLVAHPAGPRFAPRPRSSG